MRLGAVRLGGEFILCVHDAPSEARDANPVQSAPTRATRARCGKRDPRAPLNEVASILIRARDVRRGARASPRVRVRRRHRARAVVAVVAVVVIAAREEVSSGRLEREHGA